MADTSNDTTSTTAADAGRAPLRVVFAAGGTGGHIMPALAVADALSRHREIEALFVGSRREGERRLRSLVPYPVAEIGVDALVGVGLRRRLGSVARLPLAIGAAREILRDFRPELVVAAGGYVSGPTGVAARLSRVRLLVLEQNAAPGLTTRLLRPLAHAIAVSFPETLKKLGRKAVFTGNPVRPELPAAVTRDGDPLTEGPPRALNLLVLGGSQGAHGLNLMMELALPMIADSNLGLRVHHQTGAADAARLRDAYAHHGIPASVTAFIMSIGEAYAWADVVCARAGATTIAELTYCGLPAVLVPFPKAAARHQHANATAMQRGNGAVMLEEEADGTRLAETLIGLGEKPSMLASMAAASAATGRDDAAASVAELALALVDGSFPTGRTDRGTEAR